MPSTPICDDTRRAATPPIRGRADELKHVGAMVKALGHEGRGSVLVIEGPPGIGKSRLLAEVMTLAEKSDVRTLFGEAFENQRTVPFFSLFSATLRSDSPVQDIDALRHLVSSEQLSYWVVREIQDAISKAATRTPLAIVLEDVHWADNGTLLALRSMVTASPPMPVMWVLTARMGAGGAAVQETLTFLRRANAAFLQLTPMSPSAVTDMVADAVRAKVHPSLLGLAGKAHGNPFLVKELLGGLNDEGRLEVRGGWAIATGNGLPRRLSAGMQQRLDLLSGPVSELVRVASVLPDRFSAGLLAAMLERQPATLMSTLSEAVRAGLLVEDGEQLRFGHDLLREATRQSLAQSLRRAMERQSASIMLRTGATPAEVAAQLAGSAEAGDREAIGVLRQAARAVSQSDANAAADLSRRALELMPASDAEHGRVVAETVGLLNRAKRYDESEKLATAALSGASAQEEAEIRLRLPAFTRHSTQRRVEENRRALELNDISEVTRVRHQALLAYNLMLDDKDGQQRAAAEQAAAAAESVGDFESKVVTNLTLTCFDCAEGHVCRALRSLEELCALGRTNELPVAHLLATNYYANTLALVGRLDDAADQVAKGIQRARNQRNEMALDVWSTIDGMVHLTAGRLAAARAAVETQHLPEEGDITELDMMRTVVLAEVALRCDDRNLLQHSVSHARDAYNNGASVVRCTAAYILALAAWHRDDLHDAIRWSGGDITLFGTPPTPHSLDQVILTARIAAAAGDAGSHTRVLRAVQKLRHDHSEIPLFAAVTGYVRGVLESDADVLVTAAGMLAESSRPLLYAEAAEDAGSQLALVDRIGEALEHLNTAFDAYSRLGAFADARRVGRELRRLGIERRIVSQPRAKTGWESLTDSELKVVNLIAQGASNRAAAAQLQLSLHTVKTHVHNVFTKLDISSRAELVQLNQ